MLAASNKIAVNPAQIATPIPNNKKYLKIGIATGAGLLVVGVIVWFLMQPTVITEEATTQPRTITLPDQSTIWLNKGTSITYKIPFKKRHIELTGEAFFEVEANPTKPFVVSSQGTVIHATGTAFNVRSYPKEKAVEVTVESGKVKVSVAQLSGTKFYPLPNSKGNRWAWKREGNLVETVKNNNPTLWAYRLDKLEFKGQKLGAIFETLERTFDIEIHLNDEYIRKCAYTGTFEKDNPEHILNTISQNKDFDFDRNKTVYTLSGEGCGKPMADPFGERRLTN